MSDFSKLYISMNDPLNSPVFKIKDLVCESLNSVVPEPITILKIKRGPKVSFTNFGAGLDFTFVDETGPRILTVYLDCGTDIANQEEVPFNEGLVLIIGNFGQAEEVLKEIAVNFNKEFKSKSYFQKSSASDSIFELVE